MSEVKHYRNRLDVQCTTSGTGWQLVGLNGSPYATYAAAIAATTTPYPGPPSSFPTGIPRIIVQSLAAAGNAVGSSFQIRTNTLAAPTAQDVLVPASDVMVYECADVTSVWVKPSVSGDIITLGGQF